jgi:hypothetical protein
MNKHDFWFGFVAGFFMTIAVPFVSLTAAARAEHVETRPASDGCNFCTRVGPTEWHCTAMGCIDTVGDVDTLVFMGERDVACLAQMEAAMRAIEPFVSKSLDRFPVTIDDLLPDYGTPQDKLRKEIEGLDKLDAARSKWQAVKRACWKEKP